jgi:signal transduction histidine kinase/DNA-binding response OmpR family regulator
MKTYLIILLFISIPIGCIKTPDPKSQKEFTIGFSQCTMVDEWRKIMVEEMFRELSLYQDFKINLIVKDANDDNYKQINDVNEFLKLKVDLLIVSPNEAAQLTNSVENVYDSGIPVIVIDRQINSTKYTSYIGADNFSVGREAGYFSAKLLNYKGRILEITGLKGSTPAIERSSGFNEIISNYPDIKIVKKLEGAWLEERTLNLTDSLFATFNEFDLIFAQNDFMARAASSSAKKHNLKPYIIGIDGLNSEDGGVSMVLKGSIDGTILYPTGGDKAIQLAINILTGKPYERHVDLNSFRIDITNARTIWLQGEELRSQQTKIDMLGRQMNIMSFLIKKRETLLAITTSAIILLIIVVCTIYLLFRQKNSLNKALAIKTNTIISQNKIILSQRDDSVNLLMLAEETKENKLRLFTDISHEFRTAVTLIINPLEQLLKSTEDDNLRKSLRAIQNNAARLTHLSDSILRFRTLDENKYQPSFIGSNLAAFTSEIIESFREEAIKKNINLITNIPQYLYAEYDQDIIEKLMYNLLSNAIKYNKINGTVTITLKQENLKVLMRMEDSGIGIPAKDLPYIFNRFYKASNAKFTVENQGIGVGLAMTKEFIQLHGGTITVSSYENMGTTFDIIIPQFNSKVNVQSDHAPLVPINIKIENSLIPDKEKTILVVEDNPELLAVIVSLVDKFFSVLTASDGKVGLEITRKKLPSLIISDIMMPVMDGLQMCMKIKNNPLTCNIPVILLTALDAEEYSIKGFDTGADAYLTKPFNEQLLLTHIKNLIKTREKIKDSYYPSAFFQDIFKTRDVAEQDFIKKCLDFIYENTESATFSLESLAGKLNLSRSSFYRRIMEITKLRPVDFIKKARLNYAAKLLLTKNLSVNETAWRSGFSDPKYFSKCFLQEYGCSPKNYSEEFLRKVKNE